MECQKGKKIDIKSRETTNLKWQTPGPKKPVAQTARKLVAGWLTWWWWCTAK